MWRTGDQYQRTPMPGFDPALPAPLVLPKVDGQPAMIICTVGTFLPEPKDYRILIELKMPVGYTDGRTIVYLGIDNGQLEFLFPAEGAPAALDQAKAQALLDRMQTAIQDQNKPR
jgi:hypothetical protein